MVSKNKILIISWGVFPDQNGSGMIVHNLAKALGKEIVVVVGELSTSIIQWDEMNYPLYHIYTNLISTEKGRKYHKWGSFIRSFRIINRIIKENNISKIIAVFPDEYFLSLGFLLAKYNKIKLFPWFHNTYVENRKGLFKLFAQIIQPAIFKYSTSVFCMSDGLTQYYKENYNGVDFKTLRHAFDIKESEHVIDQTKSDGTYTFAYTGSINDSCKDASVRICKVIANKANCKLIVFGHRNKQELISEGIPAEAIQSYGFLEKDIFEQRLKECDVMILAHGFNGPLSDVEYKTIFPTRTIPLLYSEKPILAHLHSRSYLYSWLVEHNCAFVISSEDHQEISDQIDRFIRNTSLQNTIVINAMQISAVFDSKNVVIELLSLLKVIKID